MKRGGHRDSLSPMHFDDGGGASWPGVFLNNQIGHLHTSCAMQVVESFVNVGHQWLFHAMLLLLAYMNRGGLDEARLHSLLPWGAASLPIAFGTDHVAYIP